VGRRHKTLGVVAFRDEERGMSGSLARAAKGPLPEAFVEVHIEQGPTLLNMDAPLGIVTSIVGLARGEVTLHGAAGHAGTTPMPGRRDALVEAAELVLRVRDTALAHEGCVATVGRLNVEPGAENVIPERVTLSIDARAPDQQRLDALVAALAFEPTMTTAPAQMDDAIRAIFRGELEKRGLPAPELSSGAGHDTMVLAAAGVRCGMLFVRSGAGGISHSPEEHSDPADIELAVDVLASALERLASAR
jgi:hydantoinase/carbamoylase family amidase